MQHQTKFYRSHRLRLAPRLALHLYTVSRVDFYENHSNPTSGYGNVSVGNYGLHLVSQKMRRMEKEKNKLVGRVEEGGRVAEELRKSRGRRKRGGGGR